MPRFPLLLLSGCTFPVVDVTYPDDQPAPVLALDADTLEFGDVATDAETTLVVSNDGGEPMGIDLIEIGDATSAFSVDWDPCAITCDEAAKSEDTGDLGADTGAPRTCGGGDGSVHFVLDPGCRIPLTVSVDGTVASGELYDAVVVRSASDDTSANRWARDPIHEWRAAYVHATAPEGNPQLVVTPRTHDFDFVYTGTTATTSFVLTSVGDSDLTLDRIELSSSADPSFTLVSAPADGTVLASGATAEVVVGYTPTAVEPAYAQVFVYSDDPASPEIDLTLTGNTGLCLNDTDPWVAIVAPAGGTVSADGYPFELTLGDAEQPVSSLTCTIRSVVQGKGTLASCQPTDDSGGMTVEIPAGLLDDGPDTLLVTVTDACARSASAAVSVVEGSEATADDADGDGFSPTSVSVGFEDCDDGDAATFPGAIEDADGADDDCDGVVDEGTENVDDDGDGFAEVDGDCDDDEEDSFPSAPERGDGLDNDCDGVIDDATSLYDDDGDGYAEVNNDCDDTDAAVHPAATELCNGVDDDCDGLRDTADRCGEDHEVYVAGNIARPEQTDLLEGETIGIEILAVDTSGGSLTTLWSTDGSGSFGDASATTTTFTAPAVEDPGANENLYVIITDEDGNSDWVFSRLAVWDESFDLYGVVEEEEEGLCASASAPAWLALAGLLAGWRRRRHPRDVAR